jgi:hypothetical protein
MRILSNRLAAGLAVLLCTVVAGCGSQTRIEKLYQDPEVRGVQYQRLLVIGVTGDSDQRRRIEDLLAAGLTAEKVTAIPGYTRLGPSPALLQDDIELAAAATDSDAILIAHLVSVSTKAEVTEGRVEVKSECRGGNPIDYFLYDHEELREPDSVAMSHEVIMVTNLYDSRDGTRIWTIQSTCFQKSDFDAVLKQEARAIVRQLRRDRLIGQGGLHLRSDHMAAWTTELRACTYSTSTSSAGQSNTRGFHDLED